MFLTYQEVRTLHNIPEFIESSSQHPIKISDLVRKFGMKESKLTKGFKHLYSTGIYSFYLSCAMRYAMSMLEQGASVKEVAITLGYSKTSSFSRSFFKEYGILTSALNMRQ